LECDTKVCPHCKIDFSGEEEEKEGYGIIKWMNEGEEWNVCPACNAKWKTHSRYDEKKGCHIEVEPEEYYVLHNAPDGIVRWLKIRT
jgi:hypothetical protein